MVSGVDALLFVAATIIRGATSLATSEAPPVVDGEELEVVVVSKAIVRVKKRKHTRRISGSRCDRSTSSRCASLLVIGIVT